MKERIEGGILINSYTDFFINKYLVVDVYHLYDCSQIKKDQTIQEKTTEGSKYAYNNGDSQNMRHIFQGQIIVLLQINTCRYLKSL